MIRQYRIPNRYMPCCTLPKAQLAPIPEPTRHMLLEPLPLFVLVIKFGHARHPDRPILVTSPDPVKRVLVEVLFMGVLGMIPSKGKLARTVDSLDCS